MCNIMNNMYILCSMLQENCAAAKVKTKHKQRQPFLVFLPFNHRVLLLFYQG
jgi:hypothetical protein